MGATDLLTPNYPAFVKLRKSARDVSWRTPILFNIYGEYIVKVPCLRDTNPVSHHTFHVVRPSGGWSSSAHPVFFGSLFED